MEKKGSVNLNLKIETEVRDKNGRLIKKSSQQAQSLVKNFAGTLRGLMYGYARNQNTTLKDVNGSSRAYPNLFTQNDDVLSVNAVSGNDVYGIQVGTGDTAVTRDDYKLVTKISNGSGAGQLSYGAMTVEAVNGTPPASRFRCIRTFSNNTDSTITVKEIGLVFHERDYVAADLYFLIARDVLTTPQDVPASATLTVRYIFEVTA